MARPDIREILLYLGMAWSDLMEILLYLAMARPDRRLGGESDREILMVPMCVIMSLGLWSRISAPVARARHSQVADSCWDFKEFEAILMTGAGVLGSANDFGATVSSK